MPDKTSNNVELNQCPYEVDGKVLFIETLNRIADEYNEALEAMGDE